MLHADASTTTSVAVQATVARREGGKGHAGYLAGILCKSVCTSYVVRQSTRRLRRVRGGLNINRRRSRIVRAAFRRDSFPAHLGHTGCGTRTGGFLRRGGSLRITAIARTN